MSQITRRELIAGIWPRYREARWDDKQRILDEFTAATGYHRKYAIAVLNHPPATNGPRLRKNDVVAAAIYLVQKLEEQVHRFASFSVMPLAT